MDFVCAYDYNPVYLTLESGYATDPAGARTAMPTWMSETNFELENNTGGPATTDETMRRQFWWNWTSGGCGMSYGHRDIWQFASSPSYTGGLDTTFDDQAEAGLNFLSTRRWYDLVPDIAASILTGGRGTKYTGGGGVDMLDNQYVTFAMTADGAFGVGYFPNSRGSITFSTGGYAAGVSAYLLDPTNMTSKVSIANMAAPTHPGTNATGQQDWLLIVEQTPAAPRRIKLPRRLFVPFTARRAR